MTKILVLGGSRFIGRHLLQKLKGHDVLVLNRGNVPEDQYLPEGAVAKKVDRNSEDQMREALEGQKFDIVYDVSCITEKQAEIVVNLLNGNVGRHVHVSTASVYQLDKLPDHIPIDENYEIGPIAEGEHPYMNNKRGAEKVLWKAHSDGFPVTMVRPTFVYGPDNYMYREAYFFDRISRGRPLILPGNGEAVFDLIHVDDLAELMIQLGNAPAEKVVGEAFNGSFGKMLTGNIFAKIVSEIIGIEAEILYLPMSELKKLNWPPHLFFYPYPPTGVYGLDSRKVENALGFKFEFNYRKGLQHTYEWWQLQEPKEPDWKLDDLIVGYLKENKVDELLEFLKSHQTPQTS
ncbi:MAG: NAD-dependent epimerase/dehydratase family protein [Methanobacteriota archaeon]|nr:MAG: NAD-dependent epimerase/dehydratase family protein [Euryarchaeota archaeon]